MIKDFKLGIRILKYSFRIKAMAVCSILFFSLGIICMVLLPNTGYVAVTSYWMIAGMMFVSSVTSLGITGIVQSSSRKRALHTSVPAILNMCWCLVTYIVFLMLKLVMWQVGGREPQPGELVVYGLMVIICMIYGLGFYKLFFVAVGLFVLLFFPLCWGGEDIICQALAEIPLWVAAVIGLAEILLGAGVEYGMYRLAYRLPIDKLALNVSLRKLV